jgi:hypothetical protein
MAYMFVVYDVLTSKNKSIKAEQVDYAEWNNNVHKKMSLEAVERPDSSKVFQISGAIEIDTKEWQEKIQNLKNELAKLKK